MHKVFAETGLTGANQWNAKDAFFGLINVGTDDNQLRTPACILFNIYKI
jgi:hypothetical protein